MNNISITPAHDRSETFADGDEDEDYFEGATGKAVTSPDDDDTGADLPETIENAARWMSGKT